MVALQVPRLAESVSEAVLVEWLREDGAAVRADEPVATLETDKAAVEIAAPETGVLRHKKRPGDRVVVGDVLAEIDPDGAGKVAQPEGEAKVEAKSEPKVEPKSEPKGQPEAATPARPAPAAAPPRAPSRLPEAEGLSPAVRRLIEEHGLEPEGIEGTGKGGRILKEDVLKAIERKPEAPAAAAPASAPAAPRPAAPQASAPGQARPATAPASGEGDVRLVPMSRIRQRIAERLVQAQRTAAILTTFNELDMTAVLEARARHKELFEKRHGVRLGFMSFFTRACVLALREIPELNAEIRGTDLAYHERIHMGIAVGTPRGLVVPVVRDAHRRSFAELEAEITRLAERARDGVLSLEELTGGTFTLSNGGVYGSLLSTPILNPPQSGILGMHKIEKRPIALDDQVVIRPMMYVALSYDHRIVDGEQAVTFLVRVKERLEDPERMLLEV